jgi:hypothetical protein
MNIYHGSYVRVPEPRIIAPVRLLDFGTGFYTTTNKGQAINFTSKFVNLGKNRIVNIYDYDKTKANKELSILKFSEANLEWFRYVVANRAGKGKNSDFDIVTGPVANDQVYEVIEGFELGNYSEKEALNRFLAFKLTDQVVFKTEKSLLYIKYLSYERIRSK